MEGSPDDSTTTEPTTDNVTTGGGAHKQWLTDQNELSRMAQAYCSHSLLWDKNHPDFGNWEVRVSSYKHISELLGVGMEAAHERTTQLKEKYHEVIALCCKAKTWEERYRLLNAEGGWANYMETKMNSLETLRRQDKHFKVPGDDSPSIPAKPAAKSANTAKSRAPVKSAKNQPNKEALQKVESFKRSLVRYLMRIKRCKGDRLFTELAETLNKSTHDLHHLWYRLRGVSLQKLSCLVRSGDAPEAVCRTASLTDTDWRVLDLLMLYDDDFTIITEESVRLYEQLRPLVTLFHIAQACHVEECGQERRRQAAWLHAEVEYKKTGKTMSLVGLQRRWHELKKATADTFLKYWRAQLNDERKTKPTAEKLRPPYLHVAIARRFPHVVTQSLPEWAELVEGDRVVISLEHYKRRWGSEPELPLASDVRMSEEVLPPADTLTVPEADDDIIFVEREIETIDLDEFDEEERQVLREEKRAVESTLFDINPDENAVTKIFIDSEDDDMDDGDQPIETTDDIDKEIRDLTNAIHEEILQFEKPTDSCDSNIKIKQEKDPDIQVVEHSEIIEHSIETALENSKNQMLTIAPNDTTVDDILSFDRSNTDSVNRILKDFGLNNEDTETDEITPELEDKNFLRRTLNTEVTVKKEVEHTETIEEAWRGSDEMGLVNKSPSNDDNDASSDTDDVKPNVDIKLIMIPTVLLPRIDETKSWKTYNYENTIYVSMLDKYEIEPKRRRRRCLNVDVFVKEESIDDANEKEIKEPTETSIMNVSTHPLEAPRLIILKSNKHRSYTPISLCKNPDFNTRLKRLSVSFLLTSRNKDLIKQCIPLTIDVEKIDVAQNDENEEEIEIEGVEDVKEIKAKEEILETIDLGSGDEAPQPRIAKKIELPDINNVRKINKGILTAEVTPINVDLSRAAQVSPRPASPAGELPDDETVWYNDVTTLDYLKRTNSLIYRRGQHFTHTSPWTLTPRLAWTREGEPVIAHRSQRVPTGVTYNQYSDVTGDEGSERRNVAVRGSGRGRARGRGSRGRYMRGAWRTPRGEGWWTPSYSSPQQNALTRDTLNKILARLKDFRQGTRNTYCCLARKHCAINDARRRIAAKLQRKYGGDKQLHGCGKSKCKCCCAHLLENSKEQIAKDSRAVDKQIQAILDCSTFDDDDDVVDSDVREALEHQLILRKERLQRKAERKVEKRQEDKIEAERLLAEKREADKREAEKREADKREADKREADKREADKREAEKKATEKKEAEKKSPSPPLVPWSAASHAKRKAKQLHQKSERRERRKAIKLQKEKDKNKLPPPAIEQQDDYKEWIRERNLASEVFGFKPPPKFNPNKPPGPRTELVTNIVEPKTNKVYIKVPEDKLHEFLNQSEAPPVTHQLTKSNLAKFNQQQRMGLESFQLSDSDDEPTLTIDETKRIHRPRKTVVTVKPIENVQVSVNETVDNEREISRSPLNIDEDDSSDCVEVPVCPDEVQNDATKSQTVVPSNIVPITIPCLQSQTKSFTISIPAGTIVSNSPGKSGTVPGIPVSFPVPGIDESAAMVGSQADTSEAVKLPTGPLMMMGMDGKLKLFTGSLATQQSTAVNATAMSQAMQINNLGAAALQTTGLQTAGLQTAILHTTSLQTTSLQTTSLHTTSLQTISLQTTGLQTTGLQTTGFQTTGPQIISLQTPDPQTTGFQTTGPQIINLQTPGPQTTGFQTTGPQTTGFQTTGPQIINLQTPGPQTTGFQTTGPQTTGFQTTGPQIISLQTPGPQTTGFHTTNLQTSTLPAACSVPLDVDQTQSLPQYVEFLQTSTERLGSGGVAQLIEGHDPTAIQVLQIDLAQPLWKLTDNTVVVTEVDLPCGIAEVFSLGPRHRWLGLDLHPTSLSPVVAAPARVSLDNKLYLKMQDQPLIYAQALTFVRDMHEVRRLMLNGSKLLLYNRDTGAFTPLRTIITDKTPRRIAVYCDGAKEALGSLVQGLNIIVTKNKPAPVAPKRPAPTHRVEPKKQRADPLVINLDSDSDNEPLVNKSSQKTQANTPDTVSPGLNRFPVVRLQRVTPYGIKTHSVRRIAHKVTAPDETQQVTPEPADSDESRENSTEVVSSSPTKQITPVASNETPVATPHYVRRIIFPGTTLTKNMTSPVTPKILNVVPSFKGSVIKFNNRSIFKEGHGSIKKAASNLTGPLGTLVQLGPGNITKKPIKIILDNNNRSLLKNSVNRNSDAKSTTVADVDESKARQVARDKKSAVSTETSFKNNKDNEKLTKSVLMLEINPLKQNYNKNDKSDDSEPMKQDDEPISKDNRPIIQCNEVIAKDNKPTIQENELMEQDDEAADPEVSDDGDDAILGL